MKNTHLISTLAACILSITCMNSQADETTTQKDFKKINIEWNVLPTAFGYLSGNVSYRTNTASAIGINIGKSINNNNDDEYYNIGVAYSYALNGDYTSSGWLIKPTIGYAHYKSENNNESDSGVFTSLLFTYKWQWDSGLNLQLGFGPMYYSIKYDNQWDTDDSLNSGISLSGEFGLGYNF